MMIANSWEIKPRFNQINDFSNKTIAKPYKIIKYGSIPARLIGRNSDYLSP